MPGFTSQLCYLRSVTVGVACRVGLGFLLREMELVILASGSSEKVT